MPYVVTEICIGNKCTNCVEVCPTDSFYEGDDFVVIDVDGCIECGACAAECPYQAIILANNNKEEDLRLLNINKTLSEIYPKISVRKDDDHKLKSKLEKNISFDDYL